MKKINEFRIGNLIDSERFLAQPDEIILLDNRARHFPRYATKQEPEKIELLSEIRAYGITKKILTKQLRFTLTEENTYCLTDSSGLWSFIYDDRGDGASLTIIRYKIGSVAEWQKIIKHVTWLHEIQNLWIDFTGELLNAD
jgi:hypothetical protein